jgi:hypothetical protein
VLGATGWMLRTIFEPVFEVDFCIVNGSLASWHRAVLSGHVWRRRVQGFDTESLESRESLKSHQLRCRLPGLQPISLHESHCAPHDHWALLSGPPPAQTANLIWQGDNVTVSQRHKDRTPGFRNVAKTWELLLLILEPFAPFFFGWICLFEFASDFSHGFLSSFVLKHQSGLWKMVYCRNQTNIRNSY